MERFLRSLPFLFLFGVIFHAIFTFSIIDIYFRSPIVHGIPNLSPPTGPAKRVILIVGDGLRADTCFQEQVDGTSNAPYLHSVMRARGSFGVSHARVPTETRPGHVALIAGLYEDVSAVTKGWKANPVEFDSVFNQSVQTWSWGSPDVLPMFALHHPHVRTFCYDAETENFAADTTVTDNWVFEKVEQFLIDAKQNQTLLEQLSQPKSVFFLHLLGLDVTGHAYRPQSPLYAQNLRLVDAGVQKMVGLFEEFFGDNQTAFVFTSDHGMSNKGNHGDGHPDNTQTPLIAWGSGVSASGASSLGQSCDPTPAEWHLDGVCAHDVSQADVAALMSALIGVPYPSNSIGVLPLPYLNTSAEHKSRAAFTNMRQMLEQLLQKFDTKKQSAVIYRPFISLPDREAADGLIQTIERLFGEGRWKEAEQKSMEMIQLCLDGLRYMHTYDRVFLMGVVVIGYLGWVVVTLIALDSAKMASRSRIMTFVSGSFAVLIFSWLIVESSPLQYFIYVGITIGLWWVILHNSQTAWLRLFAKPSFWAMVVITVASLELMVYGYFRREVFFVCSLGVGLWPFFMSVSRQLAAGWFLVCTVLGGFTLLPEETGDNIYLVLGAAVALTFGLGYVSSGFVRTGKQRVILLSQCGVLLMATGLVAHTMYEFAHKRLLPDFNQTASWVILAVSWALPYFSPAEPMPRLLSVFISLAAPYVLLSISYEVLFYCCFVAALLLWVRMEQVTGRKSIVDEICSGLLFLYLGNMSFFGTGNVASISSFEISSTYRFTTVFSPFVMAALLVTKIVIPFILLSSTLAVSSVLLQTSSARVLLRAAALSDVMALTFLFLVRDEGSWRDIGMSISRFAIQNAQIIIVLVLFALSALYTRFLKTSNEQQT